MQRNIRTKDSSVKERGAAMFVMTVSVVVAAGLATSLLVVATGRSRATEARKGMETAMAVAEVEENPELLFVNDFDVYIQRTGTAVRKCVVTMPGEWKD